MYVEVRKKLDTKSLVKIMILYFRIAIVFKQSKCGLNVNNIKSH